MHYHNVLDTARLRPCLGVPFVETLVAGYNAKDNGAFLNGGNMKKAELTLPEIALIAGTRGMLGAGAGLLLADRLNNDQRKAIGWTLLIIGAISTVPLAIEVLSKRQ